MNPEHDDPKHDDPKHDDPKHGAPQHGVPQHGAPQQGAPEQGAPEQGAPEQGAPEQGDDAKKRTACDEQIADHLAAIDEALAVGHAPDLPDDASEEVRQRVERGAACLELLNQHWPQRTEKQDSHPHPSVPDTDRRQSDPTADIGVPEQLGRFQIRHELGRGGNGVVFLAFDPNLGRDVALKVPRIDVMVDEELRKRFFRESRAAAGLDHPHVVSVYEAGEIGPVCYIASAYCSGPTLAAWMREREEPVPFHMAAQLVTQLATAVEHAHCRGVLHRDLKPSNVLLSDPESDTSTKNDDALPPEDSKRSPHSTGASPTPTARITDFGLAKVTDADVEATRTGAVFGTPSYMAPEQAAGETSQIGPAADVYALGAILYELLTGRPPFQGETALEILLQVRTSDPIAPSRLRPRTPRDLETICRKCLEKDPARRYATAAQLAEDLQRFVAGTTIKARPVGRIGRSWRWCRRRPLPAGLLLALALTVTSGFAGVYWQWRRAEDRAAEAELERHSAYEQRKRAERTLGLSLKSIDHFFTNVSENVLFDQPGTYELRRELLEAARDYYKRFLEGNRRNPRLQLELAQAQLRVGIITRRTGKPAEAQVLLEEALIALTDCTQRMPEDLEAQIRLGECVLEMGRTARDRVDFETSLLHLQRAETHFEELLAAFPNNLDCQSFLCASLHDMTVTLVEIDEDARAMEYCQRAKDLVEVLIAAEPTRILHRVRLLGIYNTVGKQSYDRSSPQEAIVAFQQALDCVEGLPPGMYVNSRSAMIYSNLGNAYLRLGNTQEALTAFMTARDLLQVLVRLNPNYPEYRELLATNYQSIAIQQRRIGEGEEALHYYQHAARLFAELEERAPRNPDYRNGLAKSRLGQGYALQMTGQPADALASFQEARDIWDGLSLENPDNSEYQFLAANCCSVMGTQHSKNGDLEQAIAAYQQAVDRHQKLRKVDNTTVRREGALGAVLNDLGLTLFKSKKYDAALEACEQAIEHQLIAFHGAPKVVGYRKYLSNHYSTITRVYLATGQWSSALESCDKRRALWQGNALELYAASRGILGIAAAMDAARGDATASPDDEQLRSECVSRALDTLQESIETGFKDWAFFEADEVFDPLRSHPRFIELRAKLKARLNAI